MIQNQTDGETAARERAIIMSVSWVKLKIRQKSGELENQWYCGKVLIYNHSQRFLRIL